ncbi:MAG: hypothetical protein IKC59_05775, partial [Clostridia bacterium]|nr:hypothetical protein [Clostridia bacterium]
VAGGIMGICVGAGTKTGTPTPAYTLTMEGCVNYGNIMVEEAAGGLLCGASNNVSVVIRNCVNYGSVTCSGTLQNVAGIMARAGASATASVTVENCLNAGAISSSTYAAGIVGVHSTAALPVTVKNCINIGEISGVKGIAGIIVASAATTGTWTLENCGSYAVYTVSDASARHALVCLGAGTATVRSNGGLWAGNNTTYAQSPVAHENKTIEEVPGLIKDTLKDNADTLILNSNGNGFVLAGVKFLATQQAIAGKNEGGYRLVGGIVGATQRYLGVGFEIAVNGAAPVELETSFLNRELISTETGAAVKYPAGDFNCAYLYVVELGDLIPESGTATVTVTAYAKDVDNTTVYRGEVYTLTFTDGELTSAVVNVE